MIPDLTNETFFVLAYAAEVRRRLPLLDFLDALAFARFQCGYEEERAFALA